MSQEHEGICNCNMVVKRLTTRRRQKDKPLGNAGCAVDGITSQRAIETKVEDSRPNRRAAATGLLPKN
jgi:hypothetical protein